MAAHGGLRLSLFPCLKPVVRCVCSNVPISGGTGPAAPPAHGQKLRIRDSAAGERAPLPSVFPSPFSACADHTGKRCFCALTRERFVPPLSACVLKRHAVGRAGAGRDHRGAPLPSECWPPRRFQGERLRALCCSHISLHLPGQGQLHQLSTVPPLAVPGVAVPSRGEGARQDSIRRSCRGRGGDSRGPSAEAAAHGAGRCGSILCFSCAMLPRCTSAMPKHFMSEDGRGISNCFASGGGGQRQRGEGGGEGAPRPQLARAGAAADAAGDVHAGIGGQPSQEAVRTTPIAHARGTLDDASASAKPGHSDSNGLL